MQFLDQYARKRVERKKKRQSVVNVFVCDIFIHIEVVGEEKSEDHFWVRQTL